MSIPRLDETVSLPAEAPAADPFNTALISRLAQEYYFGSGESAGAPAAPELFGPVPGLSTTVAGVPAVLPGFPRDVPSPSAAALLETPVGLPRIMGVELPLVPGHSLAGETSGHSGDSPSLGDISSPSSLPPVHPEVVSAKPEPPLATTRTPAGAHSPGSDESYEFGEPRGIGIYQRPAETPGTSGGFPLPYSERPTGFPGWEEPLAQRYYFISEPELSAPSTLFDAKPEKGRSVTAFDAEGVRRDFPALHQRVNGRPLIWLDNAATTHKPQSVIDATSEFYSRDNSNIHRAAHTLSERATAHFEHGREKVRQFLGAADAKEIVFVRGTTEAINLIAQSYGRKNIGEGDEIILTTLEHHANIVPWQILAEQVGAKIRPVPINDRGELILEEFAKLLNDRTKIVSVTHVSNALGTINPVEEIIALAHAAGVPVVVDGAQSTPHIPINVQALDADFLVFSGHKIFGPTGIGALYGKAELLESMPPWQGGGHMIRDVTFEKTVYRHAPEKFEAGTPDIAGVVGLSAAIDYLFSVGIPSIAAYEHALLEYATAGLATVPGVRPIGTALTKASVFGFVIPGVSNQKIAKHLDDRGIAVRAGHHCALPALRHFGVEETVRPSVAFYNTYREIDRLIGALHSLPR